MSFPRAGGSVLSAAAALLVLLAGVPGCGGEGGASGSGERFSIGNRGLDEAVDSVRRERRRPSPGRPGGADDGRSRSDLPAGVPAALDSGNAAYRAGNYRAALEQFESITEEHPEVGAGWFGVYMTQRALGNEAAADSAMRRAGIRSPEAARLHGATADSTAPGAVDSDTMSS